MDRRNVEVDYCPGVGEESQVFIKEVFGFYEVLKWDSARTRRLREERVGVGCGGGIGGSVVEVERK